MYVCVCESNIIVMMLCIYAWVELKAANTMLRLGDGNIVLYIPLK